MNEFLRKIPGYRSGRKWKYVVATIFYLLYFLVALQTNNPSSMDIIIILLQRFIPLFFLWIIVFDFLGLKSKLPLFKRKSILYTILGVFILILLTPLTILMLDQFKSPEYLKNINENILIIEDDAANIDDNETKSSGDINNESEENQDSDINEEEALANERARELAEKEGLAKKEAIEKAKILKDARENPSLISEEEYKNLCSDVAWEEVVSNPESYEGAFLQKNLMVRQIAKDGITGELVFICGEEKAKNVYTGGTFNIYDRRVNKTHEIQLYDKIYVYGVMDKVYKSWSAPQPDLYIGYLEYLGKFPED